jgi:hypothetical protein
MKTRFFSLGLLICLLLIVSGAQAAVDYKMQGSVYAEISSWPHNKLRAGTRIQLYSDFMKVNSDAGLKVRLIGLNQKNDDLTPFFFGNDLYLQNLIDWTEIKLYGKLFPAGPHLELALGNVELDYSPYTIYLRDDVLQDFSDYRQHRGIALNNIALFGADANAFAIWGFGHQDLNMLGGKLTREFNNTTISGILLDYGSRNSEYIPTGIKSESVKSIDLKTNLGFWGEVSLLQAVQERESDNGSLNVVLKQSEWLLPSIAGEKLTIGYRDFPKEYDPLLRNRTPEFNSETGEYLGYNPVDRYRDQKGYYSTLELENSLFSLTTTLSQMKNHLPTVQNRYRTVETQLYTSLFAWEFDIFNIHQRQDRVLDTWVYNTQFESFSRLIVSRPIRRGHSFIIPGAELRAIDNDEEVSKNLAFFCRYTTSDYLNLEVGVSQDLDSSLSTETKSGYWFGMKYKAPNGLNVRYRYTFPEVNAGRKYSYDPDYRVREPGNYALISAEVAF